MSVERLKELLREHGAAWGVERLQAAVVVLLADARAPGPARRAVALRRPSRRRREKAGTCASHPRRRFSSISALSAKNPICGFPAVAGRPTSRPRRGRRRRRRRRTRTRRAARARSGSVWRRAVVDADLVRAPAAHGLPHAHAAGGYEASPKRR